MDMKIDQQGSDLHWRASEIDKGTLCARQLGYSRLGVVAPETGALVPVRPQWSFDLVGGSSVDDTLSAMHLEQMVGASTIRGKAVEDYFDYRFRENTAKMSLNGDVVGTQEDRDGIHHDGLGVLAIYEKDFLPRIRAVGVQVDTQTTIGEYTLHGHVDLVQETESQGRTQRVVWDWKFTGKTPSQMPARTYARGWAYDMMLSGTDAGHEAGQIGLIYLRKGLKTPKVESDTHFVTKAEHAQVRRQLVSLANMFKARYFPMADASSWVCNPKWCSYFASCRGSKTGPLPIPGEVTVL